MENASGRPERTGNGVVLTDIDIPFTRLMLFLVKLALAAVPASIILGLVWALAGMLFGGFFFGMGRMMGPGHF